MPGSPAAWGRSGSELGGLPPQPQNCRHWPDARLLPAQCIKIFGHFTHNDEATRPSEEIMVQLEDATVAMAAAKAGW